MTQEQINILLVALGVLSPLIKDLLQKFFSKHKDTADYAKQILDIANRATEDLKKTREDLAKSNQQYEETIERIREGNSAGLEAVRTELSARINRQKARIEELEKVTKIYTITFDLVTHPNLEIRNPTVQAMDDTMASQKVSAITEEDLAKYKKE